MSRSRADRAHATLADPRWTAVLARDPQADGRFVFAVRSTGVYCRPSCPSRHARPDNVEFHDTPADAERAGFRPCRRCTPDAPSPAERRDATIAALCRYIDQSEGIPSLQQLVAQAGLSAYHLHRLFKATTGLTPRQYAAARRAERVRRELRGGKRVTDAIYAAGYESDSRFYAEADARLGMRPARFRAGGDRLEIRHVVGPCTLGQVLVGLSERGICAILLGDDPDALRTELAAQFPAAQLVAAGAEAEALLGRVVSLVDAPAQRIALPLDIRGTAFQQRVWRALQQVPPGETVSYAELARRVGAPRAVRAVAGACAANRLAVAIPCHRALRSSGELAGYRWGLERKRALIRRESEE